MRIVDLLRQQSINVHLSAADKHGVLVELVHTLVAGGMVRAAEEKALVARLLAREEASSTGIGEGIALPHGKCTSVRDIVGAFGRSRAGVDFDAVDGKPVHLFFLLLAPENSAGPHLKALGRISKIVKEASVRDRLLAAGDEVQVYRILQEQDRKLP